MQNDYDLEAYYFGFEEGNRFFINRERLFINYQYCLLDMDNEFLNLEIEIENSSL